MESRRESTYCHVIILVFLWRLHHRRLATMSARHVGCRDARANMTGRHGGHYSALHSKLRWRAVKSMKRFIIISAFMARRKYIAVRTDPWVTNPSRPNHWHGHGRRLHRGNRPMTKSLCVEEGDAPQAFDFCWIFCNSRISQFLHLGVWFNLDASKLGSHFAYILHIQTVQ